MIPLFAQAVDVFLRVNAFPDLLTQPMQFHQTPQRRMGIEESEELLAADAEVMRAEGFIERRRSA